MIEQPSVPHEVGYRAYCEYLLKGERELNLQADELEEYALKAALAAEQQDYYARIKWITKRLGAIAARKPIVITRLLTGEVILPDQR